MDQSMDEKEVTIEVSDICKDFRVYKDKSHTFKDRVLFHKRNAYELNHVLDHVSFKVHKGEALGLIGHNGCGKSTTLKILNKILYPDSGSIRMKGRVSSLIELGAGFHPDMTGLENIYINASIFGLKKKEIDARLNDIIRFSELEEFIHNPVRTYSSGMYMRLAFSIAINVDADILLVDEILAVGDANFQKKCFDRLEEIKNRGTTIVIVSHSMDQIQSICDNVIWLDDGKIREMGKARDVCRDYLDEMDVRARERQEQELREQNEATTDPTILFPPADVSEQADQYASRQGNMKVRFRKVELQNLAGKPCELFRGRVSFTLDMHISADQPPKKADVEVNLYNKYGNHCFAANSLWKYGEHLEIGTDAHIKVQIKDTPLILGNYLIDLVLRDENGEVYDNLLHFLHFTVEPENASDFDDTRKNLGMIVPQDSWNISDDPKNRHIK